MALKGVIKMKRTICIFLSSVFLLLLCACSSTTDNRTRKSGKTVPQLLSERATEQSGTEEETAPEVNTAPESSTSELVVPESDVDIDLTLMNATMVYAQVYDMMTNPGNYTGKTVRMKGPFSVYQSDARNYFAVIIRDATACCSQGIEFVLTENRAYPEEYPQMGTEITVSGTFHTYSEGQMNYCELYDAVLEG